MKIALPWYPNEDYQFGDEYNITFINKPDNFDNLVNFLTEHKDIRFNILIDINEFEFDFNKIKILNAVNSNIHIILDQNTFQERGILKENNIKFYLSPAYAVSNFRTLEYVASLGVTDIYIQDDLCYNLKKTRVAADRLNLQVRMILNQIPSSVPDKGTNIRSPWFIPETVDELDKYIDIVEFEDNSWARIKVLYKTWFINKKWRENLRIINPQLKIDVWNQCMIPDFTIFKMNCGYRCMQGSACKKCNQFTEMAQDLYNKHIEYILPKEEKGESNV